MYAQHGEFLLLFVGRPTHEKGLHVLLDAMGLIAETQPDTRLLVAGRDSRKQIMAVQQRGLAGKVDLLGYVDDVTRNCLLRVANAAVFPVCTNLSVLLHWKPWPRDARSWSPTWAA